MKISKLKDVLMKLIPVGKPVLLVSSPGVGKTDSIKQVATALGYILITLHPVVDDPTDYKGMPAVITLPNGEKQAKFLPFGDLVQMIQADVPTIVFFDDLGQATPAVQAAVMQLILARHVNGHAVSDKVTFIAATNRRTDKAAVTGLITPLLDRFITVLSVEWDLEDWAAWALQNEVPPVLVAFARFKPELIGKFEPTKDMKKQPTPRSVAGLGELLKLEIDEPEVINGAVGEGFGTEFLGFYRTWLELPDRDEIYLNPTKVDVPTSPAVLYALMGSLAYGATPQNFEATCTYLERVKPEFAVLCAKDALSRNAKLKQTKAWTKFATAHAKYFGYNN